MDRILGIDLGDVRTGYAISDELGLFASTLGVIEGDDEAVLNHVVERTEEFEIITVVVGLPLSLDGGEGPRCDRTREFCGKLRDRLPDLKVVEWDERLSTVEAESHGKRRDGKGPGIDARAAQVILQRYLNWRYKNADTGPELDFGDWEF